MFDMPHCDPRDGLHDTAGDPLTASAGTTNQACREEAVGFSQDDT